MGGGRRANSLAGSLKGEGRKREQGEKEIRERERKMKREMVR